MKKLIAIILLFVAIAGRAQSLSDLLNNKLKTIWQKGNVVGFGVSIYSADTIYFVRGYGYSDLASMRPYTPHTVQKIASVSKLVLGVALMKAQEMNLLSLNDNINKFIDFRLINPRIKESNMSIYYLATHTSGIKKSIFDYKALYFPHPLPTHVKIKSLIKKITYLFLANLFNKNKYLKLRDFLYRIYSPGGKWYFPVLNFIKRRPGKCWIYNNDDASFIGLAISKASGMPYARFVHKYIFTPLGMHNTAFDFEKDKIPDSLKSSLYHFGVKIPNDYILLLTPAGGIESSVDDFTKFMQASIRGYREGNQILSKESYDFMLRRHIYKSFNQGILWRYMYNNMVGHRGDIAGATTFAYFDKKLGVGFILFANSAGGKDIEKELRQLTNLLWLYTGKFYKSQHQNGTIRALVENAKSLKQRIKNDQKKYSQSFISKLFKFLWAKIKGEKVQFFGSRKCI